MLPLATLITLYWGGVFACLAVLLFITVYTLILFSDLLIDYINPLELCDRVNQLALPEFAVHALITCGLLVRYHYFFFVANLPLCVYHVRAYADRSCFLESNTVFAELPRRRKVTETKLAFYVCLFLLYVASFVSSLIRHDGAVA
ncbi:ER-derived vesicles protein ERV14 [Porphyridium purpureum]|uniref:ER-derived vesicles protein ERV14 n=1 Tax=Porphyridium purpureum TaxID=35688 RepID=A0A5J4YRM4_PORPP|nr:ER-derived vesicles protein ERV14 [Porphyridium purpureum]|eukprot:POR8640..scf229_5